MRSVSLIFSRFRSAQNALPATVASWVGRLAGIGLQLLIIRALSTNLTMDEFAAATLLTSLAGWFGLADFGVGASAHNFIAESRARREDHRPWGLRPPFNWVHSNCLRHF